MPSKPEKINQLPAKPTEPRHQNWINEGLEKTVKSLHDDGGVVENRLDEFINKNDILSRGKLKLTFFFDNARDYIQASNYFGRRPKVDKLLGLLPKSDKEKKGKAAEIIKGRKIQGKK